MDTNEYKSEHFLLINGNILKILCFSTQTNLKLLCSCDKIFRTKLKSFIDKYFYQLFTVHGLTDGHYIPLIFSLLPNKLSSTYKYLFQALISKCATFKLDFYPKIVVADFEQAIHYFAI